MAHTGVAGLLLRRLLMRKVVDLVTALGTLLAPWRQSGKWKHCPHTRIRAIYGDEIYVAGGRRLRCRDCGNALDGPLELANV